MADTNRSTMSEEAQPQSDLQRVMLKLARTEQKTQQLQEQVNFLRSAEGDYRSTISAQKQKLIQVAKGDATLNSLKATIQQLHEQLDHDHRHHRSVVSDLEQKISNLNKDREDEMFNLKNEHQHEVSNLKKAQETTRLSLESHRATLQADLTQARHNRIRIERQSQFDIRQQHESLSGDLESARTTIKELKLGLSQVELEKERLQAEAVLSLRRCFDAQERLSDAEITIEKMGEEDRERRLNMYAMEKKVAGQLGDLRRQLSLVVDVDRPASAQEEGISSDPIPSHTDESDLIREFNSTLFEKLADSQEQLSSVNAQVSQLKKQLSRSRQEVNSYIRRIKTGALIVESPRTESDLFPTAWSTPDERIKLFKRMDLLLQETTLQNVQLSNEKKELGEQLLALHQSVQQHPKYERNTH